MFCKWVVEVVSSYSSITFNLSFTLVTIFFIVLSIIFGDTIFLSYLYTLSSQFKWSDFSPDLIYSSSVNFILSSVLKYVSFEEFNTNKPIIYSSIGVCIILCTHCPLVSY